MKKIKKKYKQVVKKLKILTKNKVNLYRAPYGEYNNTVIKAQMTELLIQFNGT